MSPGEMFFFYYYFGSLKGPSKERNFLHSKLLLRRLVFLGQFSKIGLLRAGWIVSDLF